MKVGYLRQYPNLLLIVQGEKDGMIWFHGLNDTFSVSDFTQMQVHPVFLEWKTLPDTITKEQVIDLFKPKL